jgi:hypothetical protein
MMKAGDVMEMKTTKVNKYEIRVRNHLDACWIDWFEGWEIRNLDNGEVSLTGADVDQSALHGVLNKIRDLNLTLISVVRVEPSGRQAGQVDPPRA